MDFLDIISPVPARDHSARQQSQSQLSFSSSYFALALSYSFLFLLKANYMMEKSQMLEPQEYLPKLQHNYTEITKWKK